MRPIKPNDLPEQLREVLGFDFWEEEPGGHRTLGDPVTNAHQDTKFHDMIRQLAGSLAGSSATSETKSCRGRNDHLRQAVWRRTLLTRLQAKTAPGL